MTSHTRTSLSCVLLGDELGQIKLVQLDPKHVNNIEQEIYPKSLDRGHLDDQSQGKTFTAQTLDHRASVEQRPHQHKVLEVVADCLQQEPAASRAITNIRPIKSVHEDDLDTTDKTNNLFLISNKVGQLFVCDTNAIRRRLKYCMDFEQEHSTSQFYNDRVVQERIPKVQSVDSLLSPMLSPIYYNMQNKIPVSGGQPINQTNILVVYENGDIQHVNIGQDILQSSLKIKRKAIKTLGLGYNSDARAVHWRIDGSTGICYFDSDAAASAHMKENDPLTEIVLSSPTHRISRKRNDRTQSGLYERSPCIQSRKHNEQDRLVPTQVINMITSRAEDYKPSSRVCKWSSITSLNLIYRKLALYDLIGSENFERQQTPNNFSLGSFKLNSNRLAVGGFKYALRVYDVQTQKAIYNCRTGSDKNPLACSSKGDPVTVGDLDWLGGNKTTRKSPDMLATCSGIDSVINVYDLRSPKPAFHMDLTYQTENKWQPYENHPRGCMFTSVCASGAPYSTAVPSQQLALGSTNGQLHVIDLRFVAKSHRTLGKLSGFCGGSVREIRFVSESFETSKMISCASDRFIRIHRIQTSFTSVISQKLASKVFLGTRPTCVQPVCDEISNTYLASLVSKYGSESHISTIGSGSWSLL